MVLIVLMFSVTSSPLIPSPLVNPLIRFPFLYETETETPSNFNSHEKDIFSVFNIFTKRSFHLINSSFE